MGEQRKTGRGEWILPEPDAENAGSFGPEAKRQARKKQYVQGPGWIRRKTKFLGQILGS